MRIFQTVKNDNSKRLVYLLQNKNDKTYSFVNVTSGTISPCRFNTELDAINDLERYKTEGKIKDFKEIEYINYDLKISSKDI